MIKEEVAAEDIADVVSRLTGIPVNKMMQSEKDILLHLVEELHKRVVGQNEAITAIADAFAIRLITGPDAFTIPEGIDRGTVSVFAANARAEGVIERGLEYSLDDEPLTNRTSLGLSNELIGQEASIAVESGTLYVFYPLAAVAEQAAGV